MAEYIDKQKAIDAVTVRNINPGIVNALQSLIVAIPAADVQPVRHGRWINHGWTTVCSECGEDYAFAKRNYCPNCGARMDGGET